MPGVQKPHCRPCFSQKPSWSGCSLPPSATPSIVSIVAPSAWTANTVQLFTGRPFRLTVHAPQLVVSQPMWVPVSSRFSRMKWTSSRRASTSRVCFSPLIVTVTWCLLTSGSLRARDGAPYGSFGEDADQVALVVDLAAEIGGWIALGRGGFAGGLEDVVGRRFAEERSLGPPRTHRHRRDVREREPCGGDRAAGELELDRDGGDRVVADLALDLEVRATAAWTGLGDPDLGEQLAFLEAALEQADEEIVDRDRTLA